MKTKRSNKKAKSGLKIKVPKRIKGKKTKKYKRTYLV